MYKNKYINDENEDISSLNEANMLSFSKELL